MRAIKIILSVLLLLIIVAAFAVTALCYFADPNQLKPVIANEIKKSTGSDLVIEGDLTWAFYPRFGVEIPHLMLRQQGETVPYADLKKVKMATSLSQLWHRQDKLKGEMFVSEISLGNLHAQNLTTQLHWKNQVLTLQPISADLYQGNLTGIIRISPKSTQWNWDIQAANIALQDLLSDLNGDDRKISLTGNAQVSMQGSAQGSSRQAFLQNLNGAGRFQIQQGTISGIDLNYWIKTADALLNKQPVSYSPRNQTAFDSLSGSVIIKNGVINTQDITLLSPAFSAQGAGNVDLINQIISMQLQVKPQETIKSQWQVPVIISGSLANPQIGLDISSINKLLTQEQMNKVKTHVKKQIEKHISGKTGEFIKSLLGG